MLRKCRGVVNKMWKVAEDLEENGIGELIPIVPENSDVRHTMKAEVIIQALEIVGIENLPNEKQIAFLQYVLHAPITEENKKDYVEGITEMDLLTYNPLMPYFIILDIRVGSELAETYLGFLAAMVGGYLRCGEKVDLDALLRYMIVMNNNKRIVEKGYGKTIEFNPLEFLPESCRDIIVPIYNTNKLFENDEELLRVEAKMEQARLDVLEQVIEENEAVENSEADEDSDENIIEYSEIDASAELDNLIGLEEVKKQIHSICNVAKIIKECENRGIQRQSLSYHMIFSGNPGTGKTTVARLLGQIFYDIGVLSKGHLVEVSRADLVAGYLGQTAGKVQAILEKAKGGVLFIDEAYSLTGNDDDYGKEAVETLIKGMEDYRDDLIVIAAGYPALMREFADSNPGLASRFSKTIYFPDYTPDELMKIFKSFCKDNNIGCSVIILDKIKKHFEYEFVHKRKGFGNGRMVRNYFEEMLLNQANRLVNAEKLSKRMLCSFAMEDIPKKTVDKIKPNIV